MNNKDLKHLKKFYGENFAHFCRSNFPTLLETEGLLPSIIEECFDHTHALFDDISESERVLDNFINYINAIAVQRIHKQKVQVAKLDKTVEELMDEAGYVLYPECQTEEDIQQFKKYYAKYEELCTFRGFRLNSCRVWFAVKKNVDEIKRENFPHPERQDEYGTSVISIQFSKQPFSSLSIKNRYNHIVEGCDATFGNNLDNIIPGLTFAFEKEYGLTSDANVNQEALSFALENYCFGTNAKMYRTIIEDDTYFYCENNTIVSDEGKTFCLDKSQYLLIDKYIVDFKNKKVLCFENGNIVEKPNESFIKSLGNIQDIKLTKDDGGNKVVVILPDKGENIKITLDSHNGIMGLVNNNVTEIGDSFLQENKALVKVELNNLRTCGDYFLDANKVLTNFKAEKLESVGNYCFYSNNSLTNLTLNNLNTCGIGFMRNNVALENFKADKLEHVGSEFLFNNKSLKSLTLNNLRTCGKMFLGSNFKLQEFNAEKLEKVGDFFLCANKELTKLKLNNLVSCGIGFMHANLGLKYFQAEKLEEVGDKFLFANRNLISLNLNNLKRVGGLFLPNNTSLQEFNAEKLERIGYGFLNSNVDELKKFNAPLIQNINDISSIAVKNFLEAKKQTKNSVENEWF